MSSLTRSMAAPPSFATVRLVNRLVLPCILDAAMANRLDRDFLDGLILLAIVQANVAPLTRDPTLQRTYAAYDEPPPDELRRPVSVNAVAHSLRLPYETVRRRVVRLARAGTCEISARGVIVPASALTSPAHMLAMIAIWEQIRMLYGRLRELGMLDALVRAEDRDAWSGEAPPMRAVVRVASDYMLRAVEGLMGEFDGLLAGVVWFTVLCVGAGPPDGGTGASEPGLAPDAPLRPVRTAELARRLEAPQETIRRQVGELAARGLLRRTPKGLVVPAEVLARPWAVRSMRENFADLQRMFGGLARLGVLAAWDRDAPPLRGAA